MCILENLIKNLQCEILCHLKPCHLLVLAQTNKYWKDFVFSEKYLKFRMIREFPAYWKNKPENMSYKTFYRKLLWCSSLYVMRNNLVKICDNIIHLSVDKKLTFINDIYGNLYQLPNLPIEPLNLKEMIPIRTNIRKCYLYDNDLYLLTIDNDLFKDSIKIAENVKWFSYYSNTYAYISIDHKLYVSSTITQFTVVDDNVRDFQIFANMQVFIVSLTGQLKLCKFIKYCSTPTSQYELKPCIRTLIGSGISDIVSVDQTAKLKTNTGEYIKYHKGHIKKSHYKYKTLLDKEILFKYKDPNVKLYLLRN